MSSRMLKWLLLASVLLVALPVVAGASTSRVAGLGTQGDYIKDYTNIFTYPSCVPNVGNLVYGEFGVVTDYDENYSEYFQTEDRAVGAVLGKLVGDVMITREEIAGLMAGLLCVDTPPTGTTRLTDWITEHAATLGRRYTSELARRRDRSAGYRSN